MSTILDSLKKSSDKRDGPEKLSIDNFNFSNSQKQSKSGLTVIIILVFITAVILAYGYKYINKQVDSTQAKSEETNIQPMHQEGSEKSKISLVNPSNINPKQNKIEKPNTEAVKKQLAEKVKAQQFSKTNTVNAKDDPINLSQTKNQNDNQTKSRRDNASKSISKLESKDSRKEAGDTIIKLNPPNENNEKIKPKPKPIVKKQEHMYVFQLPFSIRKEIPKFKLNIHIFDEDPDRRVAVINGAKFVVGDLIEEQVLIKEIVREGVLLEFNNHVFLLPNL